MSEHPTVLQSSPHLNIKVYPGATLVLRVLLHSQIAETLLFRLTLDDWILDDGQIISLSSRIEPSYLYLCQGNKVNQTITLSIPFLLQPGQHLKSWLRFPAIQEEAIPIELKILSSVQKQDKPQAVEVSLPVTLPFTSQLSDTRNQAPAAIFGLLSGLIDLDKIPSRRLLAEILIILCQTGEEYAQTESGAQLLNQLKTTPFFQNGIIAFAFAQIPNWIADSLKSTNAILSNQSLLYLWEQWLLSLVPEDIAVDRKKAEISVPFLANFVFKLGGSAERWFAGILLGLALISPRITINLKDLTSGEASLSKATLESGSSREKSAVWNRATAATKTLFPALACLATLPARWLVVELLLLLCRQGDKYAQTDAGSILAQLKQTSFFDNGVLAFSAAQVPRWLAITQEAASSYHACVGTQMGQGGLLYLGEQWLWSLVPTELNVSQPKVDTSVSDAAAEVVASLGMDAERWFTGVVLGLALVSPRIAATVEAIATKAPSPVEMPPPQIDFEDVIGAKGSIQR
ncbi:hypothetical protein [Coleofasciculus sp. H7-2]|uniref:hypothetical protein n=1 Tax=Coleofasciculus sp. H7-2 TaxID=3351545 RepID=UPI0036720790